MHISQIKQSRFLTRGDVGKGVLVTISSISQENIAMEGQPQELRWCLFFTETDKPLVLNSTNAQIIAQITGSEETDYWVGKKIVLYDDPTVSFGGKLVGGIRCRAPRNIPPQTSKPLFNPKPPPAPQPPQAPALPPEEMQSDLPGEDDSVPF